MTRLSVHGLASAVRATYRELVLKRSRDQQFWILSAFIPTFVIARLIVYALPAVHLQVGSSHVHHFTYGFILLAITGFIAIIKEGPASRWLATLYGVGLALAVDEAGIWLRLQPGYYSRQSYDAIVLVSAILINATYFSAFWLALTRTVKKWIRHPF